MAADERLPLVAHRDVLRADPVRDVLGDGEVLAASGLIRKTRSPADARGIDVTLTATGLARLQAAYPVHLASVRGRVLDHVDRDSLPCFREVLAAIARALE